MKKLTSNQIRDMFLEFFKSKDHMVEKGHSLIPHDDPTLLWINSGVAALKKYFDGTIKPEKNRITNVQKAIRSNDIENVGKTARHHTFFEMLGNFSIGDYFKKEAIEFAYEFLTSEQWMGLDKERLYFTIHPDDQEAFDLWHKHIGVPADHIAKFEHNYWQIGEGPSGPNTEIFYDRGKEFDPENRGVELFFNDEDNDRYVEVWNIVFSQFNAVEGVPRSEFKELPQKNIDTGMGFERLVNIIQGGETNFDTDLFLPIILETQQFSPIKYEDNKIAYRVIADHIRTITFALSEGALFSNEGRGYVLRRIIRRAIRYGKQLNIQGPFMYKLVDKVGEIMQSFYPAVYESRERVSKLVKIEEERFEQTLQDGEKLLQSLLETSENKVLSGEEVFKLYDTYGFPYELTVEIAAENGFTVDEKGYQNQMQQRKELSRSSRVNVESFGSQNEKLMDYTAAYAFLGYHQLEAKGKILAIFKNGELVDEIDDEGLVALDQSPFYAESGGQIGDTGVFRNNQVEAQVMDVTKAPHKQHLHQVKVLKGVLRVGDEVEGKVDEYRRNLIKRNHTSVHLLNAALHQVLGNHISQAGSYVSDEYARFDFTHFEKVSEEQQKEIEQIVNNWILEGHPVTTKSMPLDEAKASGAIGLFDDKYGDIVRVVDVDGFSKELCGGTHVNNINECGLFVIESEESVGSGIRRMTTRTSAGALTYYLAKEALLNQTMQHLGVNATNKLSEKIDSLYDQIDKLNQQVEEMNQQQLALKLDQVLQQSDGKTLIFSEVLDSKLVKSFMDQLKAKAPELLIFGIFKQEDKLNMACYSPKAFIDKGLKAGQLVKEAAQLADGNGGGKPDFAQAGARNIEKTEECLQFVKGKVNSLL